MTPLKSGLAWAENQLKDLPTVSLGKVSLIGLDWATLALVVAMCIWKDTTDSNTTLNAWLFFLAALHGVSYANFRTAVQSPTTAPSGASQTMIPVQPQPSVLPLTTTTTTTVSPGGT